MKVNGIRAIDYRKDGDALSVIFADTTFDEVSKIDTSTMEVRTDDGDIVASFVGMTLSTIQYDAATKTFTVVADRTDRSATAAIMQALQDENTNLRRQIEENSGAMIELAARVEEVNAKADESSEGLMEVAGMVAGLYSTGGDTSNEPTTTEPTDEVAGDATGSNTAE